ncbi:hypothetical protein CBR_g36719 [Chara braunii]|uniref:Uncharacterized protein n=1 Tax=Chara braunii TaxID=69332 RepID=A0A388LLG9_CHABU|nr:hypothetical protein CBR_g36719 [Chara braunii]|eukprot:GBG83101.1 hypothetical protein CBR_g36719 [Chara braunii]
MDDQHPDQYSKALPGEAARDMSSSSPPPPPPPSISSTVNEQDLKYLGFFRIALIRAVSYIYALYEHAKESSGALKPRVDSVEGTVKTVVGPVYNKLEDKPAKLLKFVDRKVDDVFHVLPEYVPSYVKEKSAMAYDAVKKHTPETAKNVAHEVQEQGLVKTAKGLYDKYEPAAEKGLYEAWKAALELPMVPQAVQIASPWAMFGAEKFNSTMSFLRESRLPVITPVANWVPLVPVEKLDQLLNQVPKEVLGAREGAHLHE